MKKNIIVALIAITATSFAAFKTVNSYNQATVNQQQGCYLFIESTPVSDYDYLGDVKVSGMFSSGQFDDVKGGLIKAAKKKYPNCNGLIFHFVSGEADHVDAILFK
jgi:hypothetical protein